MFRFYIRNSLLNRNCFNILAMCYEKSAKNRKTRLDHKRIKTRDTFASPFIDNLNSVL